jgi:5-methyltetrahydropteroyltriglutamate--homocysteine methyltransferase
MASREAGGLQVSQRSGAEVELTAPYARSKVAQRKPLTLDEHGFLKGVTKVTGKITLPAPSTVNFCDYADHSIYPETRTSSPIFREEIAALATAGCRHIQLDEVAVALLCDPGIRGRCDRQQSRRAHRPVHRRRHEAIAECPPYVIVCVHMCRGNFKGHYLGSGSYESVAERFFAETKVDHFLLEFDTARAGVAPLRFVPKTKGVVLGMIKLEDAGHRDRR